MHTYPLPSATRRGNSLPFQLSLLLCFLCSSPLGHDALGVCILCFLHMNLFICPRLCFIRSKYTSGYLSCERQTQTDWLFCQPK